MTATAVLRKPHPARAVFTAAIVALATAWPLAPAAAQDPRAPEPVGSIPARTIAVGQSARLDLTPYFRDADGDALAYAATVSDGAVATVSVSGDILTVEGVAPGTVVVTVFASDPGGLSATQRTEVTIEAPNRAPEPVGTIPRQSLAPGQWVSIGVSTYFNDPEGDVLSFSVTTSDPAVASVAVSGDIVTITQRGSGTAIVNAVARDPGGLSAQQGIPVLAGLQQAGATRRRAARNRATRTRATRNRAARAGATPADATRPDHARNAAAVREREAQRSHGVAHRVVHSRSGARICRGHKCRPTAGRRHHRRFRLDGRRSRQLHRYQLL